MEKWPYFKISELETIHINQKDSLAERRERGAHPGKGYFARICRRSD
jgi:hypothetical protein